MPELTRHLINLLFPAILLIFVTLYVVALLAGLEPELALFRASGAAALLAILGRLATNILEKAPPPAGPRAEREENDSVGQHLDVAIGESDHESAQPLRPDFDSPVGLESGKE